MSLIQLSRCRGGGSLLQDGQVGHGGGGPGVQSAKDKSEACDEFINIIHVVRKQVIPILVVGTKRPIVANKFRLQPPAMTKVLVPFLAQCPGKEII